MQDEKRSIWGWAMYDWANSAFATTVMAGFFPIFFKSYCHTSADVQSSTFELGLGNSLASLAVALMAPVMGAFADRGRARKRFLVAFAYLGALMTSCLFWVQGGNVVLALFLYAMGVIGFSGANIFYDALLPVVASEKKVDFVSGLGYSMGYLGGGLLFLLNVVMALKPQAFGIADQAAAIRLSFLSVGIWWGGFTIWTLLTVREEGPAASAAAGGKSMVREGLRQFFRTLKKIRCLKTVFVFLGAYWLYIDGVDTIVRMAVDYGLSIGFDSKDLIVALLITQFVGFPAALLYGKLGERWGVRKALFLGIGAYMGITIWGTMMTRKFEFYILAVLIGLVQGGVQALSRSYFSRLIPKDQAGEFYGFYNMFGKFSAIVGPALVGAVGLLVKRLLMPESPTAAQMAEVGRLATRAGIASILILFLGGAILLHFVDEEKGKRDIKSFS